MGSLVHGRPSHITHDDWCVKAVTESDFPERARGEDDEEGSSEVKKGRILFCEMIRVTDILTSILSEFYTVKAIGVPIPCSGRWKTSTGEGQTNSDSA